MAEYKNGFNYRGNMSVDKEDYAPDVQTGRAVFVDEDKYTNDASYKAKVDKCVEEGFHRISEGDTPSGGGGGTSEPLVIKATTEGTTTTLDKTFGEIKEAFNNGKMIWLEHTDEIRAFVVYTPVNQFTASEPSGGAITFVLDNGLTYMAATDQDYPQSDK